jgi:glycosyltransferase involved in cell wall biosynthesis
LADPRAASHGAPAGQDAVPGERSATREGAGPPRSISVVIPAYNEAEGIERTLRETDSAMAAFGAPYEIVLVDDGSADATTERARRAMTRLEHARLIRLEANAGKGWALVRGAQAARADLILFMDADLDVHPRQLAILHRALVDDRADVVIGAKLHPDSEIAYPPKRRALSLGYYALVRLLFRLPVRDTQTGLKLYRREVLERIVPRLLVKRFAHDLEALVNAHRLGYRIVEVPVVVTQERPFPRIGLLDAFLIAKDTAAIFYRTYVLRYYDRVGEETEAKPPDRAVSETAAERDAYEAPPPVHEVDVEEQAAPPGADQYPSRTTLRSGSPAA